MGRLEALRKEGLSPLARGHRFKIKGVEHRRGSIPACAGAPHAAGRSGATPEVYPRLRGGTSGAHAHGCPLGGLSPLARGHLDLCSVRRPVHGSIPACAGAPDSRSAKVGPTGVYPRLRGGTSTTDRRVNHHEGLSPLARGHRGRLRSISFSAGSIPACAGAPRLCLPARCWMTVYPRLRGGTDGADGDRSRCSGLSPLARGHRRVAPLWRFGVGSIPACAGAPRVENVPRRNAGVYPRLRGGTQRDTVPSDRY